MKNKFLFILSLFTVLIFNSCRNESDNFGSTIYNYEFRIVYPSTYSTINAENAIIVMKNLSTNEEIRQTTNGEGLAKFILAPGNYSVSVTKNLTASESEALAGIAQEAYLHASVSQLQITSNGNQTIQLGGSPVGNWVIKEYYYSGARGTHYFYDMFIEIYNNSSETLYADGLLLGTTKSNSPASGPNGFIAQGLEDVYLATVIKIPGSGREHPVRPGESIVIAADGINHKTDPNGNPKSPVNLGKGIADFEVYYYINPTTPDTDNPEVPNMDIVYITESMRRMFDYTPGVMGTGLVIFRSENPSQLETFVEPNSTSSSKYAKVPKSDIIDGLDAVPNSTTTVDKKRLPVNVDAGMNTVGRAYTGTSLRRKVKQTINGRRVLQDTNNSTNDFEVNNTPTPKSW